jgi:hypothetical protein
MKNIKLIIGSIALTIAVASCTKTVDDVRPVDLIEAETAITDSVNVERAVLGVYSGLQSGNYYGQVWIAYQDLYTDGIAFSGSFTTHGEIRDKNINPSNLQINNTWQTIYNTIGRANYVIEEAAKVPLLPATLNRVMGEVRFVRALCYFDLVKVFGGVPLVTKPTKTKDIIDMSPRASVADVYNQIIADLQFAETNLPASIASSPTTRSSRWAAKALLARVYLQKGDHALAAAKATEVINSGVYQLQSNFADIFIRENSAETIFAVNFTINDQNGLAAATNPAVGGQKFYASASLEAAYAANDQRKAATVRVISGRRTMAKYFRFASSDDDVQVLRLAEMFLIRAEALARQGVAANAPSAQVIQDINTIRARAGLAAAAPLTNTAALTEILLQRRLEFAHEGHRFADLQRFGGPFTGASAFRNLWPIPTLQRQYNPSLTQNPGYN